MTDTVGKQKVESAVGRCCRISAAMLEMADSGDPREEKRRAFQKANAGQAALLRQAADMADKMEAAYAPMLAALEPLAMTARTQANFLRHQARDATSGTARALIEAAERWEKLHDDAAAAIATAKVTP